MSISRAAGLGASLSSAALVMGLLYCIPIPVAAEKGDATDHDTINVLETFVCQNGGIKYRGRSGWMCTDPNSGVLTGGFGGRGSGTIGGNPGQSNNGDPSQPSGDADAKPDDGCGNPVIRSTGNKVEPELDFAGSGEMPLYLQRTFNSYWSGIGIFGKYWLSNFDYSLSASTVNSVPILWIQYPDGRRIKFIYNATAARYNEDKPQPVAWAKKNTDGTYIVYNESRGTERYGTDGHITELKNEQEVGWTFAYTGQYLQKVTHTSGRAISFTWTNNQLTQVTDPDLNVYTYTYTPNVFGTGRGRLASATLPGTPATTITYHYEDSRFPGALTGKSFNNVRYSTFAYDALARAISTEHAGGVEKYGFSYVVDTSASLTAPPAPPPPGGYLTERERDWCDGRPNCSIPFAATSGSLVDIPTRLTVTVTNPLNKKTAYLYLDDRLTSVTGQASAHCPASYKERTYDANDYPNLVTDFEEGVVDYDFDAHGHLLKAVEAPGKPEARTTTYTWDEAKNRVLTRTVAGYNVVAYGYDPDGRIASIEVKNISTKGVSNQTRKTTYAYTLHPNGLVSEIEVDGPIANDTIISKYSAAGDQISVADALGHTTTYGGYDALGRPGYIISPNNDRTDFTYDGRGRVTTEKKTINGVVQTVTYTYDGAGNLASIQRPDGQKRVYVYDPALRLLREYEQESTGVFAQKRYTYNNLSRVTRIDTERTTSPVSAPTISVPTSSDTGSYTVSWTPVGDTTSYRLSESVNGGAWTLIQSTAATSRAISGKGNGTYSYRVSACNAAGCGPTSAADSIVVSLAGPPAIPTMTAPPSNNSDGTYSAAWGAVPGATSYRLDEQQETFGWNEVYNGTGTSKAFDKGAVSAQFSYKVRACNTAGCSGYSAVRTVIVESSCPTCRAALSPGGTDETIAAVNGGGQ